MQPNEGPFDVAGRRVSAARLMELATTLPPLLERLLPLARRVVGFVRVLVVLTALAVVAIMASFLIVVRPSTLPAFIVLLALAAFLAGPALVLWLLHGALDEVLGLPEWLRSSPELLRTHGAEIATLAASARGDLTGASGRGRVHLFRDLFASGKLLLAAHRDLPEYGRALRFLSVPFLIAVAVSLPAAVIEWLFAFGFMLVALASLVIG